MYAFAVADRSTPPQAAVVRPIDAPHTRLDHRVDEGLVQQRQHVGGVALSTHQPALLTATPVAGVLGARHHHRSGHGMPHLGILSVDDSRGTYRRIPGAALALKIVNEIERESLSGAGKRIDRPRSPSPVRHDPHSP